MQGVPSQKQPPILVFQAYRRVEDRVIFLSMIEFQKMEHAQTLAQAIVNTIPEPFVVLDDQFRVLAASASFYRVFKVESDQTRGRLLYSLGDGQWDIPALRLLLETIIPEQASMDGFEVEHDFPNLGRRTMLLNARQVVYEDSESTTILLAFMDVTARRTIEREKAKLLEQTEELLRQKEVLLQEMQHRVANSLQIIASILLLKARAVSSEETRQHLKDAHQRVMSVAEVQRHLYESDGIDQIDVSVYLTKLCDSLASSMMATGQPIMVKVMADAGTIGSDKAVSIGLIVTELVINAVKYAFPPSQEPMLASRSPMRSTAWTGNSSLPTMAFGRKAGASSNTGLGTAIVQALVKQLNAVVEVSSSPAGMSIAITCATFTSHMPRAA
jgi:two-component sensor histidine kinase